MESISDNVIENIYNNYGPVIGKVCENTNNKLLNNIIETIKSENILTNIGKTFVKEQYNNLPESNLTNSLVNQVVLLKDNVSSPELNIKGGNQLNNSIVTNELLLAEQPNIINQELQLEDEYFYNYKVNIFNYKISIWILILVLIVITCIGYFIYKYCYSSSNILNYKKIDVIDIQKSEKSKKNKNLSNQMENISKSYNSNDTSIYSFDTNSTKSIKSNKSNKSNKSDKSNKSNKSNKSDKSNKST